MTAHNKHTCHSCAERLEEGRVSMAEYPSTRFERSVDRTIAEENRRFSADPAAMQEAAEEGDRMRQQLVLEGMTFLAIPGDRLPDGSIQR